MSNIEDSNSSLHAQLKRWQRIMLIAIVMVILSQCGLYFYVLGGRVQSSKSTNDFNCTGGAASNSISCPGVAVPEGVILNLGKSYVDIPIIRVDHSSGVIGQYFNFDVRIVDSVVGNKNWNAKQFTVANSRTSELVTVVLWRHAGGSKGDGHGRLARDSAPHQWKKGDSFVIVYGPSKG